jgi:uncharacterized membrane protein
LIIVSLSAVLLVINTPKPVAASPGISLSENFIPTDDSDPNKGNPDTVASVSAGAQKYNMYQGWTPNVYLSERVYLKFDISKIPSGATIDSAVLMLNSRYGPSTGVSPYPPTWHLVDARPVNNDDWSEWTITWNNAPQPEDTVLATDNFQADDYVGEFAWCSWDVTSYVVSQITGGDKTISIALVGQNEGVYNSAGWFYSKDAGPTYTDKFPRLQVNWVALSELLISPDNQTGAPGSTLEYTVTTRNYSGAAATFDLAVDSKWNTSLPSSVGPIPDGGEENVTLTVTCPYAYGVQDTITVTVTCQGSPQITTNDKCTAITPPIVTMADAYVIKQDPEANLGDAKSVVVGTQLVDYNPPSKPGSPEDCRGYWMLDLGDIPSDATIDNATFSVYTHYGSENGGWDGNVPHFDNNANVTVTLKEVTDDDWDETTITWSNAPAMGSSFGSKVVTPIDRRWYSWDVTSFVASQLAGDKKISLGMVSENEGAIHVFVPWTAKEDTAYWVGQESRLIIWYHITVNRGVKVEISPSSKSGSAGGALTYTVKVTNTGSVSDTYSLTTADNASWSRTISPTSLSLAAGAFSTATLTVTIPASAENNARDNVRVTATGTGVSAENSCIAYVSPLGVEVSISQTSQDGSPGAALTYTVTVRNTGGVADTYVLTKSDNASWSPSLSPSTLSLAAGASGTSTLTVTISVSAENNTQDSVTVTATSQTDSSVSGNASCTARCVKNVVPGGVQVTISPASNSGNPGERLEFSVTFTNTGTATGTFDLNAEDTKGWGPTLAVTPPRITLAGGASRTIGLSITIPSTAAGGDSATITVAATSQADSTINGNATCTATAQAGGGISPFVYVGAVVVIVVIIAAVIVIKPF